MKILVLNAGSSSLKYTIYQGLDLEMLSKGVVEKIGDQDSLITHKYKKGQTLKEIVIEKEVADHYQALQMIVTLLSEGEYSILNEISEIDAVGHRVVHGGEFFSAPRLIDEELKTRIEELIPLAPLHNPPNLLGITVSQEIFPQAKQIAVFDTAFHQTIPPKAYRYAIPERLYKDYGIRVYGMHGTSHSYITKTSAKYLEKKLDKVNLITIHLGNGCSMSAVRNGMCIDTSMGFSPLPGLVMGTRSGDIDPSLIFHLIREHGFSSEDVENILNKESGLKGLTGLTDLRDIHREIEEGNKDTKLALDIYCYRIKKYIGAYLAAIGPLDAIVFTAGVGENDGIVRSMSVEGLEHVGIVLDKTKNDSAESTIRSIQSDESRIKILVVPTDEEKQIALSTLDFL